MFFWEESPCVYVFGVHVDWLEDGLHPPGLLQLLLRVSETCEGVVAFVPFDGSVERHHSFKGTFGLVRPSELLHVLHRQAAGPQNLHHRAEDVAGA